MVDFSTILVRCKIDLLLRKSYVRKFTKLMIPTILGLAHI